MNRFRFALPSLVSFVPIPLPTRWLALIWLELRQSLPLACYGLVFSILITIAGEMMERGASGGFASLRSELPHSVLFVGSLWAVVVGSSLYSSDLGSKLAGFRTSRPISHSAWFWTKFLVGLFAVLLVIDGSTVLVSWNAPKTGMTEGMSYAYIACFPIIHTLMYSLAVLGTCLFRKALIGGVSAILCYAVATLAIISFPGTMQLEPVNIYNALHTNERIGIVDFTKHGFPIVYGALAVFAIVGSIASYQVAKPNQPVFQWLSKILVQSNRVE